MWEPWRPQRIDADLRRLRSLNANTVRVVLPAHFFGYPEPEERYLERLREFVGIAARNGLHVQLTLFDWWGDYRDIEGSKQWARAVLERYVGDARIAFVELRNEIDTTDGDAHRVDARAGSVAARPPPRTYSGDRVGRRQHAGARPACARRRAPGGRTARFLRRALLHRRGRAGTARLLDAPRPRRADAALDRRARLPDLDDAQRLRGCPAHAVEPGSRTGALLQALLHSARAARAACARDLDPRRLRTRRDPGLGRARPRAGVSLRSLSRGRLGEAGGGRCPSTVRWGGRDGLQRRLRSGCCRRGRNLRTGGLGLDRRAAARSRHEAGAIRRRVRSDRRPPGGCGTFLVTPVTAPVQSGSARLSAWVRGTRAALRVAIVWFDRGPAARAEMDVGAGGGSLAQSCGRRQAASREPRSHELSSRAHG